MDLRVLCFPDVRSASRAPDAHKARCPTGAKSRLHRSSEENVQVHKSDQSRAEDGAEPLRKQLDRANADLEEFVSLTAHNVRQSLREYFGNGLGRASCKTAI